MNFYWEKKKTYMKVEKRFKKNSNEINYHIVRNEMNIKKETRPLIR